MRLGQLLFTQGFGTRRECGALVAAGQVTIAGRPCDDVDLEVEPEGLDFEVRGEAWTYHEHAVLVMNKPPGYECSQKPRHHPSVYALLPAPLRNRGVQAIGRLDEDTTGVLLFTDDGTLIHRLTSPRHHVPKVYEVTCKHPVDADQIGKLTRGVLLHDENETVRAAACEATGPSSLRMTLTEGKYHQVKRMIAAAGNRVEALHRSEFGPVRAEGLAQGGWRWLSEAESSSVSRRQPSAVEP
ncbi:MAG: 16S rRNA pseudouridine(516) synthase [Caldimonas sp.]